MRLHIDKMRIERGQPVHRPEVHTVVRGHICGSAIELASGKSVILVEIDDSSGLGIKLGQPVQRGYPDIPVGPLEYILHYLAMKSVLLCPSPDHVAATVKLDDTNTISYPQGTVPGLAECIHLPVIPGGIYFIIHHFSDCGIEIDHSIVRAYPHLAVPVQIQCARPSSGQFRHSRDYTLTGSIHQVQASAKGGNIQDIRVRVIDHSPYPGRRDVASPAEIPEPFLSCIGHQAPKVSPHPHLAAPVDYQFLDGIIGKAGIGSVEIRENPAGVHSEQPGPVGSDINAPVGRVFDNGGDRSIIDTGRSIQPKLVTGKSIHRLRYHHHSGVIGRKPHIPLAVDKDVVDLHIVGAIREPGGTVVYILSSFQVENLEPVLFRPYVETTRNHTPALPLHLHGLYHTHSVRPCNPVDSHSVPLKDEQAVAMGGDVYVQTDRIFHQSRNAEPVAESLCIRIPGDGHFCR